MKLSKNNPSTSSLTGKKVDSFHICNKEFGTNYLFCTISQIESNCIADSDMEILTDKKGYRYQREITPHLKNLFRFKKV